MWGRKPSPGALILPPERTQLEIVLPLVSSPPAGFAPCCSHQEEFLSWWKVLSHCNFPLCNQKYIHHSLEGRHNSDVFESPASPLISVTSPHGNQSILLKPKTDLVSPLQKALQRLPNLYNGHLDFILLLPSPPPDPISCYSLSHSAPAAWPHFLLSTHT